MSLPALRSTFSDWQEAARQIAGTVNAMMRGRSNATGEVTLEANATSTTVTDANVSENSRIHLMPTTETAGNATWWIASVSNGSFTISHDSTADLDRTFKYGHSG